MCHSIKKWQSIKRNSCQKVLHTDSKRFVEIIVANVKSAILISCTTQTFNCIYVNPFNIQIALSIAIGSVGYFLDGISKSVDGSVQYNLLVDQGIYGRHEFFLSAVVIGLFSAIISFFIVIANRQGNPKLAAQVK